MANSPYIWGPSYATNLQPGGGELDQVTGRVRINDGPQNLVGFATFENNLTTGWSLGTTGALTNGIPTGTPTFGSGTTSLTLGTTNITPINGIYSLTYTASAATTVGNMLASDPLTVPNKFLSKLLPFSFSYQVTSGAANVNMSGTSSNSFGIAFYDPTNAVWLTNTGNFNFTQSAGVGTCSGTVLMNSNTNTVRMIVYNVNATAGAATLYFDDFYLGPQNNAYGAVMTDWVAFTPTITGFGTPTGVSFVSRRIGDSLFVRGEFVSGTSTAVSAQISFGFAGGNSNVTMDATKTPTNSVLGKGMTSVAGTTTYFGSLSVIANAGSAVLLGIRTSTTADSAAATANIIAANGNFVSVEFSVPISGWSSNVIQSSDTLTQSVAAQAACSTAFAASATTPINFDTVAEDTSGSVTTSATAWKFTAPVTGDYFVSVTLLSGTGTATISVFKNGSLFKSLFSISTTVVLGGTTVLSLKAGDFIDIRPGAAVTLTTSVSTNTVSIYRLANPATIQATDVVAMKYTNTAGTSVANTGDNNVPFATKVYDTTNSYNTATGIYTCPVAGRYSVKGTINYTSATYGVNNQLICSVYKNGALDTYGDIAPVMAIVTLPFGSVIDTTVLCNPGDTLEMRAQNTRSAGATTLNTGAGFNHIEISRGN